MSALASASSQPSTAVTSDHFYDVPEDSPVEPASDWYIYHSVDASGVDLTMGFNFAKRGALYQVKGWRTRTMGDSVLERLEYSGAFSPKQNRFTGIEFDAFARLDNKHDINGRFSDRGKAFMLEGITQPLFPAKRDSKGKLVSEYKDSVTIPPGFEGDKDKPSRSDGAKGLAGKSQTTQTKQRGSATSGDIWVRSAVVVDPLHASSTTTRDGETMTNTYARNSFTRLYEIPNFFNFSLSASWEDPPTEIAEGEVFERRITVKATGSPSLTPAAAHDVGLSFWFSANGGPAVQTKRDTEQLFRPGSDSAYGTTPGNKAVVAVGATYQFTMPKNPGGKSFTIAVASPIGAITLYTYTKREGGQSLDSKAGGSSSGKAEIHGVTKPEGVRWVYPDGSVHEYAYGGLTTLTPGTKLVVGPGSEVVIEDPSGNYVHIKSNSNATIENGKLVVRKGR